MAIPFDFSYGNWPSVITTELMTQESVSFADMQSDGKDLYWSELRPFEKGRVALMKRLPNGELVELLKEVSIRTRVHEYGGGAFCVQNGILYFTNDKDKAYYRFEKGKLKKICENAELRFADGCITPDGRAIYLVCEEHRSQGGVLNYLVRINREGEQQVVASGHDFYSSPRLSPDGKKLAFFTWDFPNMPWDGSELWLIELPKESAWEKPSPVKIAGGLDESICQIQWSPRGDLYFCSDRTGYWNLYRFQNGKVDCLHEKKAEFGLPAWVFGRSTYAFISDETLICIFCEKGIDRLALLYPEEKRLEKLKLPFTYASHLCAIGRKAYFVGASPTHFPSIVELDVDTGFIQIVKLGVKAELGREWISLPQFIEYPSLHGKVGYGIFYPPKNPKVQKIQEQELSPLILRCHGGPTGRYSVFLSLETQFWTSRGFSVLDVNYGGSTGYGREYMKRLESQWGILDVADVLSAAHTLSKSGLVDSQRLFIRGGSAGGYTVLCTLAYDQTFSGGTSYYGVSDLELLCKNTHKFESHYVNRLVAPYPEELAIIRARSPIHQIDHISTPILLLQGEEDAVVLPEQSEAIYEALKMRGLPVRYILFPGEGHGFRLADTIRQAFEEELRFYQGLLSTSRPLQ